MIIEINKYNELTFPPSFEGGKVYFYKIRNSHLAKEGEDWEFSILRETSLNKADRKGQPMWLREVSLTKRNEKFFSSSLDKYYKISSGEVIIEEGNLLDILPISKIDWETAYYGTHSVQVRAYYGQNEYYITLSVLSEKERNLIPDWIIEKINKIKKEKESAHKKYLEQILSDYLFLEQEIKNLAQKYPPKTFNPTLNLSSSSIQSPNLGYQMRLEIYQSKDNILAYMQVSHDIRNVIMDNNLEMLRYQNFSGDIPMGERDFKEWLDKNIVIINKQKTIEFLPKYSSWQDITPDFWHIYNANFDKDDYGWEGDDEILIKINEFEARIPCKRRVFKTGYNATLWYDYFDFSKIENEITKQVIERKLIENDFPARRLSEITIEKFNWYKGAGADASRIVEELKEKGFKAYYEMVNVADNNLYDEDGNVYAISPRNKMDIKVLIKIVNNKEE